AQALVDLAVQPLLALLDGEHHHHAHAHADQREQGQAEETGQNGLPAAEVEVAHAGPPCRAAWQRLHQGRSPRRHTRSPCRLPHDPAVRYDPISLRLFLHIAHSGSISAASARMDLALAAASRRVLQLEADVGTPLLERRARGVTLTQAGLALLRHAQDIEDAYSRLRSDMAQHGRGVLGSVRVAANSSAVLQFLPADLRAFTTAHADLRI